MGAKDEGIWCAGSNTHTLHKKNCLRCWVKFHQETVQMIQSIKVLLAAGVPALILGLDGEISGESSAQHSQQVQGSFKEQVD
jgi:hypothetical protein